MPNLISFSNISKQKSKLWIYPMLFGVLGGLMGLFLRYVYTGGVTGFTLKNLLHSHSHVMLLGFVFNALVALLWIHFTKSIDRKSNFIYICLQVCVGILLVGFVIQGYALFTILFSTLHLWLSYFLLIRLWKRLEGDKAILNFVKIGIVFHFVASIGPYALGPLKALGLDNSPWYQQSIYFYLHFQYFGSFFLWLLAVFFKQTRILLSKEQTYAIVISVILLFTHSLDYSFNHWLINVLGGIGSLLLFGIFFSLRDELLKSKLPYRLFYIVLLSVLFLNCAGSLPFVTDLVVGNRFLLIAWLHLLFLGVYLPFVWIELPIKVKKTVWLMYILSVVATELLLVFPSEISNLFATSIMILLFISYFGVVLCICIVHLNFLINTSKNDITRAR
jgi:hypothetical protein